MGCRVLGSMCMGKLQTDRHVSPAAVLQELQYTQTAILPFLGSKRGAIPDILSWQCS